MYNKTFASIDDLESLLYSPVSLRFHIGDPDIPNVVNIAKGRAAAARVRQHCRQCDVDSMISQAVSSGLVKGIGIIKTLYKRKAFHPTLIAPEEFGVMRENYTKLDSDMEAFGSYMLDMSRAHDAKKLVAWVEKGAAGLEADEDLVKVMVPPAEGMVPVLFGFDDLPDDLTLTVDSHSSSPAFTQDHKSLVFDLVKIGAMSPADAVEELDVTDPEALQMGITRRDIAKAKAEQAKEQAKLAAKGGKH